MIIDNETIVALVQELQLYRLAEKHFPDTPVRMVKACGCTGPLPECKCAKRERLVKAFLDEYTVEKKP